MVFDKNISPVWGEYIAHLSNINSLAGNSLDNLCKKLLFKNNAISVPIGSSLSHPLLHTGIVEANKFVNGLQIIASGYNAISLKAKDLSDPGRTYGLQSNYNKIAHFYSQAAMTSHMQSCRSLPNTTMVWHRIKEGDIREFPGMAQPVRPKPRSDCWIGGGQRGSAYIVNESTSSTPRNSLPVFITNILKPVPLIPTTHVDKNEILADAIDQENYADKLGIKLDKLNTIIDSCNIPISKTLQTPIAIYDFNDLFNSQIENILDPNYSATTQIEAIKIQKRKNNFELVDISLSEYLSNPGSYFVVLDLPKHIAFTTTNYMHDYGVALKAIALMPTLIIHPSLVNTSSDTIAENVYLLLDHIKKQSLEQLLDRKAYQAALQELASTTTYWDGVLQVLGGAEQTRIKTALAAIKRTTINTEMTKTANAKMLKACSTPEFRQISENNEALTKYKDTLTKTVQSRIAVSRDSHNALNEKMELETKLKDVQDKLVEINENLNSLLTNENKLRASVSETQANHKELTDNLKSINFDIENEQYNKNIVITEIVLREERGFTWSIPMSQDAPRSLANVTLSAGSPINVDSFTDETAARYFLQIRDHVIGSREHIQAVTHILTLPNINLERITMVTTKPNEIYVDWADKPREKCSVIVGGPYRINLSYANGKLMGQLFLASEDGIFGIKAVANDTVELKQHPHSKEMKVNRTDPSEFVRFVQTPTTMCFGNSEPNLVKAFTAKNIVEIANTVYSWCSSAWSKDPWGANWPWFPTPDRVSIEGKFNQPKETK